MVNWLALPDIMASVLTNLNRSLPGIMPKHGVSTPVFVSGCVVMLLLAARTPQIAAESLSPDEAVTIAFRASPLRDFGEVWKSVRTTMLEPDQANGPYVRVGLHVVLAYIATTTKEPPFEYVIDNAFEPLSPRLDFAVEHKVPLVFTVGGGPWFDNGAAGRAFKNWRRNCMWYGDNRVQAGLEVTADGNLAELENGTSRDRPGSPQGEIYLTLSRYNRLYQEMRQRNRRAAMALIARFNRDHPELCDGVTVDGELEQNWLHGDQVTDYNPLAILEFRDWIRGIGLYGPGCELASYGYVNATRYREDVTGLQNFNADFGTEFTTWKLKHYHDADFVRADTDFDYQFPVGVSANPGGFDPPRTNLQDRSFLASGDEATTFEQLWNLFRASLVYHEFAFCAKDAMEAGIPREKIFTHAIPGHLAETPVDSNYIDPDRFWRSAIPPWTAANDYSCLGIDLYGDQTAWVPDYVARWSRGGWAIPECHFNSAREYEVYWQAGLRLATPLVWPQQFIKNDELTIQGQAVRAFIQSHRTRPRRVPSRQ